jgi:hypothetical protein
MLKRIHLLLFLLFCMGFVAAQSAELAKEKKAPSLNGHKFLTSTYLKSSFVSTSFQTHVGFGTTSVLDVPGIEIGDYEILSFKGQIVFFDLDVQYQQRFTPWLALYISVKAAGRAGTDMSTMLVDGVNALSGGDIGWLINITQTEKLNLSGTLSLSNLNGNFLNISQYFEDLINNEPYPSVTKAVPALIAGVGLRSAYAFNPSYGLQLNLDYGYGESFERDHSKGFFMLGVMGDLDFNPKRNVPLGLGLGYTLSSAPTVVMNEGGTSNLFLGRIGYTGSDDFELGLQITYYDLHLSRVEERSYITKVMLSFRFYF